MGVPHRSFGGRLRTHLPGRFVPHMPRERLQRGPCRRRTGGTAAAPIFEFGVIETFKFDCMSPARQLHAAMFGWQRLVRRLPVEGVMVRR